MQLQNAKYKNMLIQQSTYKSVWLETINLICVIYFSECWQKAGRQQWLRWVLSGSEMNFNRFGCIIIIQSSIPAGTEGNTRRF